MSNSLVLGFFIGGGGGGRGGRGYILLSEFDAGTPKCLL